MSCRGSGATCRRGSLERRPASRPSGFQSCATSGRVAPGLSSSPSDGRRARQDHLVAVAAAQRTRPRRRARERQRAVAIGQVRDRRRRGSRACASTRRSPAARGAASCSPSASSSRRSGSRSSNRVNTSRRRERSGARDPRSRSTSTPGVDVALEGRELLRDARQVGVLAQVLAGASRRRSRRCARARCLERPVLLQQLGGGLVADARHAGDVVGGVALQPDEVGHQLGRDAVALDHALAVVHARVGDARARSSSPARGRSSASW